MKVVFLFFVIHLVSILGDHVFMGTEYDSF